MPEIKPPLWKTVTRAGILVGALGIVAGLTLFDILDYAEFTLMATIAITTNMPSNTMPITMTGSFPYWGLVIGGLRLVISSRQIAIVTDAWKSFAPLFTS